MRKVINTILTIILVLTVVGIATFPVQAKADWLADISCYFSPTCVAKEYAGSVINSFAASVGYLILSVSSWALIASGFVLNISMVLTLNIKTLYEATPAIDQVWLLIRNLSSMFIIFALIYTSILTILDIAKTSASTLIKNIIMAGILINFSLFFTKTAIDASNLISLQFYRALVPSSATISKSDLSTIITSSYSKGGLSDIFMQNMKLPSIYGNPKGMITGAANTDFFHIVVGTIGGSILMWLAAGSILAAAIAFIIRVVMLLLLMGFSPIYFVGMIFPQVRTSISNKWLGWLTGQLLFMPVYLILMYISVRFLTGVNGVGFFNQLDKAREVNGTANNFLLTTVGLILQYTIAYVLLLAPLIGAMQFGGKSMLWGQSAQKWVSGKLWGGFGSVNQHVIGRGAMKLQEKLSTSSFATRNPNIAIMANGALKNVASRELLGSKGGYEKRLKDYSKKREEFGKKGIKLSDSDKAQAISIGLSDWDTKNNSLQKKIDAANRMRSDELISSEEREKFAKEAAKFSVELKTRKDADNKGTRSKYLEAEALKARKEEYAKNLEKSRDFFTTKARQDAAKAIRDDMNKSEEKKLLDALSKIKKDDGGDDGDEGKADSKDKK